MPSAAASIENRDVRIGIEPGDVVAGMILRRSELHAESQGALQERQLAPFAAVFIQAPEDVDRVAGLDRPVRPPVDGVDDRVGLVRKLKIEDQILVLRLRIARVVGAERLIGRR